MRIRHKLIFLGIAFPLMATFISIKTSIFGLLLDLLGPYSSLDIFESFALNESSATLFILPAIILAILCLMGGVACWSLILFPSYQALRMSSKLSTAGLLLPFAVVSQLCWQCIKPIYPFAYLSITMKQLLSSPLFIIGYCSYVLMGVPQVVLWHFSRGCEKRLFTALISWSISAVCAIAAFLLWEAQLSVAHQREVLAVGGPCELALRRVLAGEDAGRGAGSGRPQIDGSVAREVGDSAAIG